MPVVIVSAVLVSVMIVPVLVMARATVVAVSNVSFGICVRQM